MTENGYIKLSRSILTWGWYEDGNTFRVFLDILLHANYEDGEYLGEKVSKGEAVIGRKKIAKRLGISEQQVRTALQHLIKSGEISTSKTTNKYSVVRVEKWDLYQGYYDTSNQQNNQRATNKQPTSNQQVTTSNKNNKNNKKNNYISYRGKKKNNNNVLDIEDLDVEAFKEGFYG